MSRRFRIFALVVLCGVSSPCFALDCRALFDELAKKTNTYAKEVNESPYYSRIFIKQGEVDSRPLEFFPRTAPDAKNFIFNVLPNPQIIPRWVTRKVFKESRDINIKPFERMRNTANRGLVKISQFDDFKDSTVFQHFTQPQLSGFSTFLLDFLAIGGVFSIVDFVKPYARNGYIDLNVLIQSKEWVNVIRYDYRYHEIKMKLKEGDLSEFDAHKEAYNLNLDYKKYFEYMATEYAGDDFEEMKKHLRGNGLFSNVMWFVDHGVETNSAFRAFDPGPLSSHQQEELFQIYHGLYFGYQVVSQWIWGQREMSEDALKTILDNPHEKKLVSFYESGKLTRLELLYFVGLDLYLETYFKEMDILQIAPFKIRDNLITKERNTDTLEDLHNQIDTNIDAQKNMP